MITKEIFSEVLNSLTPEQINKAMDSNHDFILLELNVFNAGYNVSFKGVHYTEETEKEAHETGQVFTDKESFLILIEESQTVNKTLLNLLV